MGSRIDNEKSTISVMIGMYCRGHHHVASSGRLCQDCKELLDYAKERLTRCPHGDKKPTCRRCTIHCYRQEMRKRVTEVMRWSGKRMLLYHPIVAIRHMLQR
ncbi:MAG: nitrous oxide-stimulated promoter family protein [Muribaculaceae bacterium]|nr:nitrous oxide-stimulated promoter family protein [Muribaculaceae bacterium]